MTHKWIAKAISKPGALHRSLGVPQGERFPAKRIAKAAHSSNPLLAKRARLAQTLKAMHHGSGGSCPAMRVLGGHIHGRIRAKRLDRRPRG